MKKNAQFKRINPNEWDEKSGYTEGRKLAQLVYRREEDDFHISDNLRITEKGTLYEEAFIKGYEEMYEDLKQNHGRTYLEVYYEDYCYDNDEYKYDYD